MSTGKLPTPARRLFSPSADRGVAEALRTETVGGLLLLLGAVVALVWANSPWSDSYRDLLDLSFGPDRLAGIDLHLDLQVRDWAADGLLAVFFFVAGIELKQELVVGDLKDPRRALLPVVAAVCGVAVPAVVFVAVVAGEPAAATGWAIPVATDIAFALAVLAVIGSHLPNGLRSFLLTLAVVDDLIAITIIAIFYTADLSFLPLLGALVVIAAFGLVARTRAATVWLLAPLAVLAWVLVHSSGVHATVAGVLLALTLPVRPGADGRPALGGQIEHAVRPFSAGVAVPVFALCAAGVTVIGSDASGFGSAVSDPVFWGIVAGLVLGKPLGIVVGTFATARLTRAELDSSLSWQDVVGLGLLSGVGFTVSLLIGELAFGDGGARDDHVRLGILIASVLAALLASLVLGRRNAAYRAAELAGRDVEGPTASQ
jgi:NhaA family Na+:H+ antiporter